MSLLVETLEKSVTTSLTIQRKLGSNEQLTPEEVAYVIGALSDKLTTLYECINRRKFT